MAVDDQCDVIFFDRSRLVAVASCNQFFVAVAQLGGLMLGFAFIKFSGYLVFIEIYG